MTDETRRRGLIELGAACDESIRCGGSGWVKTSRLSGTKEDRSVANMRALVDLDFAEGRKSGVMPQGQWTFRITGLGRQVISEASLREDKPEMFNTNDEEAD